jgi:hypothetical protein
MSGIMNYDWSVFWLGYLFGAMLLSSLTEGIQQFVEFAIHGRPPAAVVNPHQRRG